MSKYIGIIDSFSRFEKQQESYFRVSKLAASTQNEFGTVDSNGYATKLNTVGNSNHSSLILTPTTFVHAPTFTSGYFSGSLGGLSRDAAAAAALKLSTKLFAPDWDDEYYFAVKFESAASMDTQKLITIGEIASPQPSSGIEISADGKTLFAYQRVYNGATKRASYPINISTEYDLIIHFSGTNDIADWRIILNGVQVTPTYVSDSSFLGRTIYPGSSAYLMGAGYYVSSALSFEGHWGNTVMNYGSPRIPELTRLLNR